MNCDIKYYFNTSDKNDENGHPIDQDLTSFDQLAGAFSEFQEAYADKNPKRIQPVLNITIEPRLNGVESASATRFISKAWFSNKVKTDELGIIMGKIDDDGKRTYYMWNTKDLGELKRIFYELVVNHRTPDFTHWDRNVFLSD